MSVPCFPLHPSLAHRGREAVAQPRGWPTARWSAQAALLTGLWLSGGLLIAGLGLDRAIAGPQVAELQCRLGSAPWQPCRMEIEDVGLHWVLRIGPQRIEFRHSGDGALSMQKGGGSWQPVTATWQAGTSLCWDGVCAKGDIPLD